MTWSGTLRRLDLGTGVWVLERPGGGRVALVGAVPSELDGRRVEVDGQPFAGMGIGMVGTEMVEVSAIRPV